LNLKAFQQCPLTCWNPTTNYRDTADRP